MGIVLDSDLISSNSDLISSNSDLISSNSDLISSETDHTIMSDSRILLKFIDCVTDLSHSSLEVQNDIDDYQYDINILNRSIDEFDVEEVNKKIEVGQHNMAMIKQMNESRCVEVLGSLRTNLDEIIRSISIDELYTEMEYMEQSLSEMGMSVVIGSSSDSDLISSDSDLISSDSDLISSDN